jgi:Ca-activated chloride channel family protein
MDNAEPVSLSWELSRNPIDSPDGTRLIVMARLASRKLEGEKRVPLNVSLALDRSGSMSGAKLEACKHAAKFLVSHLTSEDRISVVAFSSSVETVVPHQNATAKDRIRQELGKLYANGGTNLSGGWLGSAERVERSREEQAVNRVLLLTDGQANEGVTDAQKLMQMVGELRGRGVQTSCIGFGSDFHEDLLRSMADAGGGNFHYIQTPEDAPTIFAREVHELLAVAAQNVKLRIAPSEHIRLSAVLNDYPHRAVPGGIELDLGDLLAGDEKRVLIELLVPPGSAGQGVAVLSMAYQQVLGELAFREQAAFVKMGSLQDVQINPVVWREVLLCQTASEMKEAQKEADRGSLDHARTRLIETRDKLDKSEYSKDPDFVQQKFELDRIIGMLKDRASYQSSGRKSLSYSSVSISRLKDYVRGGDIDPELRQKLASVTVMTFVAGPQMAGFAMLKNLHERWPRCEVIATAEADQHRAAGLPDVHELDPEQPDSMAAAVALFDQSEALVCVGFDDMPAALDAEMVRLAARGVPILFLGENLQPEWATAVVSDNPGLCLFALWMEMRRG